MKMNFLKKMNQIKKSSIINNAENIHRLNIDTSKQVFVGEYINESDFKAFRKHYALFNHALFTVPINVPYSPLRKGLHAVKYLRQLLCDALIACHEYWNHILVSTNRDTLLSKLKEKEQNYTICFMDYVITHYLSNDNNKETLDFPDLAHLIFDMIYAAQDANVSALVWLITILTHPDRKDVMNQCVREFYQKKNQFSGDLISDLSRYDKLETMPIHWAIINEVLRYRPPATILPHWTKEAFRLHAKKSGEKDIIIPKGCLVFPSMFETCKQSVMGDDRADKFDVNHMREKSYVSGGLKKMENEGYIPFGKGKHVCMGRYYAKNQMWLFLLCLQQVFGNERKESIEIGKARVGMGGKEIKNKRDIYGEDIRYNPTSFPKHTFFEMCG